MTEIDADITREEEYEEVDFELPKRVLVIIGTLLLTTVIGVGSTFYFYQKSKEVNAVPNESSLPVGDLSTLPGIISAVEKLMILPEDEEPTFATVSDPAQLAKQQFFLKAEVGDKVLMYTKSKRAILYSPKKNKLVEVGVVVLGNDPSSFEPGIPSGQKP